MTKRQLLERKVIAQSSTRRPYAARLKIVLDDSTKLSIDGSTTLLTNSNYIIKLEPEIGKYKDGQEISVIVEGFATAGEAEKAGLRATLGMLWAAITGRYAVRLVYHTPLPCTVFDRTQSKGLTMSGTLKITVGKSVNELVQKFDDILSSSSDVDSRLLVAAELFASARLETTERAKFIGLVSSLEPLADQKKFDNDELMKLIALFKEQLRQVESLDEGIKASLLGRVEQLKKESITQSIIRLTSEMLPNNPAAQETIKEAYRIRSAILHEGSTDADLVEKSQEVEEIVRQILQAAIGSKFQLQ